MKVSIITVVFNGADTIKHCIDSVLCQDYGNIEYIIVDGGSTDGTNEIVKKYGSNVTHFISEPDKGIYDAMNKGIKLVTGELIGIINADDFYVSPSVIREAVTLIETSNADACYADLEYVDKDNLDKVTRKWKSGMYGTSSFLNGWMPPHPTFFLKKVNYEKFGGFRLDMGTAADYELMLRMIYKNKLRIAYQNKVWVRMRTGGISNNSLSNRLLANKNDKKAWHVNNLKPRFYTTILKPIRKVLQFLPTTV